MTLTCALLAPALLILLLCWLNRNLDAPEDQPRSLRQSGFIQGSFVFGVAMFAVMAFAAPLTTDFGTEYSPYFAAMALLTSLCAPFGFLSGIRYGVGGLTIRTCFGRVHRLRWEDVTAVQPGSSYNPEARRRQDGWIIAGGRKFPVNYAMSGAEDFIRRAQQECRQRGVDPTPPRKDDLFHGNVPNAGTILFGWWFAGGTVAFLLAAFTVLCVIHPEEAADDLWMIAVLAGVLIWWGLHVWRGVKVGRNPERYGKKTFESFFGKGSWPGK